MVRLKVLGGKRDTTASVQFQFHMVRLKGSSRTDARLSCRISIPYGAIKSYLLSFPRFCGLISIPYGAIKSIKVFNNAMRKLNFNSIWCD